VVIGGSAAGDSGASGATVSVLVSPVVISDVVTGPGGAGSGWAALVLVDTTANAPMANKALAPTVAETNLICFEFTFDLSISVCGEPQPASGAAPRKMRSGHR
jgi:hypothetical protein